MKALSVKQPWANLIASGKKTIEIRTRRTNYRGKLLIVSSMRPKTEPAGQALAIVELVDCRPLTRSDREASCHSHVRRAFAWVLENARPITPWPVKGRLGIYEVALPKHSRREVVGDGLARL